MERHGGGTVPHQVPGVTAALLVTVTGLVLWILSLTLFNKIWYVRSEDVLAEEGGSALLPCVYSDPDLPKNLTVIWKDPNDKILVILRPNPTNVDSRVRTFPDVHAQGNFSIQIRDLVQKDSGRYECHIRNADIQRNIWLNVTGKVKKLEVSSPKPEVWINGLDLV